MRVLSSSLFIVVAALGVGACAEDPRYLDPMQNLEVGADPTMQGMPATGSLTLPIRLPNMQDMNEAAALQAKYPNITIPYVRVGDIAIEVEWTVKNLSDQDAVAFVSMNGANELFAYVPGKFVDPNAVEPPPPPPSLTGGAPVHIPANGATSGSFTEQQVKEASVDLDMITRGLVAPEHAILENGDADLPQFQPTQLIDPTMPDLGTMPVGDPIPAAAYAQLVRVDMVLTADQHVVMEYSVRVRDFRGLLAPMLMQEPAADLQAFAPVDYVPTFPPP
jgi:hypothetical protein